ncbi:MAG: hypothetical protein PGN22_02560 [Agrobacterium cavarae]
MTVTPNGDTFNYTRNGANKVAEMVAAAIIDPGTGTPQTALPAGRAAAANSVPVAMSNEDKAALDAAKSNYTVNGGIYTNGNARAAGNGILAVITTAGTATLTFGGVDIQFTFVVGPTILPLAITKTTLGTAAGSFYAIS